ncbi:MAG: hypothetical protein JWR21_2383 [Herminiimonas sp.]|nr:hypothetical protein [Herminiimonas sp.]
MLKVTIHSGMLEDRTVSNQLAVLDIAYQNKSALADYLVALSLRNFGELEPAMVMKYPRWSASVWVLIARALGHVLYRRTQVPPSSKVDRRCAYATRICAYVELLTTEQRGLELGSVEILQRGKARGTYTALFEEDILGSRTVEFAYGCKALNSAELLMRSICWAYSKTDVLGPIPALILPTTMCVDGIDRFHVAALSEPAMTGFRRYQAEGNVKVEPGFESLPRAEDYVQFLMKG